MKINSINSFKPSFGHISKQAVDAVRKQAEGYFASNSSYSTSPKFSLMNSAELKQLENLVKRASVLDDSWIHFEPDKGLVVQFYKDCNPQQISRFDYKNEGNIGASLDVLESAVNTAESAEGARVDENNELSGIWDRNRYSTYKVKQSYDRFKNIDDNKILNKIYSYTYYVEENC